MKDTGHMTEILTLIFFFYFFGVFHCFSINIRIEVHLFLFVLGNERTLIACKSLRSTLRFTRLTRDQCPFISLKEMLKFIIYRSGTSK